MSRKTRKTRRQSRLQSGIPAQTGTVSDRLNKALDLHRHGDLDAACALYHSILQQEPEHFEALQLLGVLRIRQQRYTEALEYLDHALCIRADVVAVHNNRGIALHHLGRPQESLASYQRALQANPDYAEAWYNQGIVQQETGQYPEALASYERALALKPDYFEAHGNRGNTLKSLHRLEEALGSYQRALAIRPDYATALYNLSETLGDLGRFDESVENYHAAVQLAPHPGHYSNYLFMLACYAERQTPAALLEAARGWEGVALTAAERAAARLRRFSPPPRQGRPLRVGIVSAELGQHAVAYFLMSWLRHLDPERISLYLYPVLMRSEAASQVFQSLGARWHPLDRLDDASAAEQIRSDGIDILMDVSGHTAHNRLGLFAHRAAPVQCHYIGFFATTGLTEMDYFLADEVLVPSALADQFVETVWRLPRPWLAYAPLENAPEPRWQAPDDGTVCLGSFNNLIKVREDCLDLWARVMRALPEAWLLLKDGKATDAATRQRICDGLSRRGVDDRRVAFAARTASWQEHMALYDQVDIALDTLPLNSGTTAFDALWMGVPLITLAGNTLAGRMGAAIVAGMGQSDWIARDSDDYVAKVVALARDLSLRKRLRPGQRERMRASPLCDGVGLARVLEDAFETWFDRYVGSTSSGLRVEHRPAVSGRTPDQILQQALDLHRRGQLAEAQACYDTLLAQDPRHFDALQLAGALAAQQERWQQALEYVDHALMIRQDQAEVHYNRGIILQNLQRPEAALDSYRQALRLDHGHLEARNNLGLMLQRLNRLDEALVAYETVLRIKPDYAEVHCNKGNVLKDMQRLDEALSCYEQAIRFRPDYALAHYNMGNLFAARERADQALIHYEYALQLGFCRAEVYFNRGNALKKMGLLQEALASYGQALRLDPDYAEAHYNSGNLLREISQPDEGLAHYRQAISTRPDFADVYVNRGNACKDMGRLAEAEASYRQAVSLCPQHPGYRSNLLFLLGYCPERQSVQDYLQEARAWEQSVLTDAERQAVATQRFDRPARIGRPLRVGVLSAELGQHAVACFLNTWMAHLNRDRVQLFLYPTRQIDDQHAQGFRAMADAVCPVDDLDDAAAVARIRSDALDILMDTSGHTGSNRLGIIARRAAPIQCHYIGYFASTGLSEMDYFLADEVLIPSALDDRFVEQVWRLPRPWLAYGPLEQAPQIDWKPAADGRICLGSFNNLVKVRENCLALWARVMQALPEAWLLLKDGRASDASTQRRVTETLQQWGVTPDRVVFAARTAAWQEHMMLYNQVDIALDTLPLNSGTTAFDALWMGVPLITLAGDHMAGRMGAAIVTGMGQPDWVATTADDYVARVVALARDIPTRTALRANQRERMRVSPLCDGADLARTLEDTFETWFDRWSLSGTA